jgi:hypothetical protein
MPTVSPAQLPVRLITNGSLLDRKHVQAGIARIGRGPGARSGSSSMLRPRRRAGSHQRQPDSPGEHARRLVRCTELAPTWVQTCLFSLDGKPPAETEMQCLPATCFSPLRRSLAGVHLYGLARPSLQPEAAAAGRSIRPGWSICRRGFANAACRCDQSLIQAIAPVGGKRCTHADLG